SIFYIKEESYRHLILNSPQPGTWRASVMPLKVPPKGADFCLSADLLNGTAEPGAKFNDIYYSQEGDADSHGLYSRLDIDVGINVSRPGDYSIRGWLYDSSGNKIISSEDRRHLNAGRHKVNLSYNGLVIRSRQAQAPLSLRDLSLIDGAGSLIDHRDLACDIPGCKYDDFREPPARFTGSFSDEGAGLGQEGKFAGLAIDVGLDVAKKNQYIVKGTLYDQAGKRMTGAGKSTYTYPLSPGSRDMELDFDGFSIADAAANGPYQLRDLGLYTGKRWSTLVDYLPDAYTTSSYDYSQFEGRPARIEGNLTDYGSDINGDGKYDFLTVEGCINVSRPGNYTLEGELHDLGGRQLIWSTDQDLLDSGIHKMYLDFDGKTLWKLGINGPYRLENLTLWSDNWTFVDAGDEYDTAFYNSSDFVDPVYPEKTISGSGSGELLVTITSRDRVPAFHGRYSYDMVGVNIPPISSTMKVTSSKSGYSYKLPGAFMPNKPNNFTVQAKGVKSLNIGLKKAQNNASRTWITAQIQADRNGVASADNDLLSPGIYQFKIFGESEDNATWVDLAFTAVKKVIIQGDFSLAINTSGLPSGNYSISARALNGSFSLDDLEMDGLSFTT
ncbi:MAG TPA: hypothetical protein VN455_01690, partial [Methanotrichaceae archaeon]|nr:hypothetical protein [Methanotrichaceae archaeon]